MARMGYKDGQGLGKDKQGMSQALQVEKTSKRGGKIIHERDMPRGRRLHEFILYSLNSKLSLVNIFILLNTNEFQFNSIQSVY